MNASRIAIVTLMALMLFAALAQANEEAETAAVPEAKPVQSLTSLSPEAAAKLRPLPFALREVLLDERDQLSVLLARHAEAMDPMQRLAIQKEIEVLKAATEVSLVNVQITHARRDGRSDDLEKLEAVLERMTAAPETKLQAPTTSR